MYKYNLKVLNTKLQVISVAVATLCVSIGLKYNAKSKPKKQAEEVEESAYIAAPFYAGPLPEVSKIRSLLQVLSGQASVWQLVPLRVLLRCLHSHDPEVHHKALHLLLHRASLDAADANTMLQAATPLLLLHLCQRTSYTPLPLPPSQEDAEKELLRLMKFAPVRSEVRNKGKRVYLESAWEFQTTHHSTKNLLTSLLVSSQSPENCAYYLQNNTLILLRRLHESHHTMHPSDKRKEVLCQILNNILLNSSSIDSFISSGWLQLLGEWSRGGMMQATRLLHNLHTLFHPHAGVFYDNNVFLVSCHMPLQADVVFIHGLRGAANRTWRQASAQDLLRNKKQGVVDVKSKEEELKDDDVKETSSNWPRDWLATEVAGLRVLMVEYQNNLSHWSLGEPLEIKSLQEQADVLLASLLKAGLGDRPFVLVGHSMGGILIKQLVNTSSKQQHLNDVFKQLRGVVFYSVPHRGSRLVDASRNASLLLSPTKQVLQLSADSADLKQLHDEFMHSVQQSDVRVLSFCEGVPTRVALNFKSHIVPPHSSDIGIGDLHVMRDSDHVTVCKPRDRLAPAYTLARDFLRSCLQ